MRRFGRHGLTYEDGKPVFNWFEDHFGVKSHTVLPTRDAVIPPRFAATHLRRKMTFLAPSSLPPRTSYTRLLSSDRLFNASHLPALTSGRAISMMSSRAAVGSSLDQATPSPILKSIPLTFLSSILRLGRSWVHSGAQPMPRPAETNIDTPQALTLLREPKANVERYDGLRVRIVGGRHTS